MRVITLEDNIRLGWGNYSGKRLYINGIPLTYILDYLVTHKDFCKEQTVEYLKNYFDVDLSQVIDSISHEWADKNYYQLYREENPLKLPNENLRHEFNKKYKDYYLDFVYWMGHDSDFDFIFGLDKTDVIHHIHPLVYGGKNELENLIHISDFNHEILHLNPHEDEEKYCHQAVVYLRYLRDPFTQENNRYLAENYDVKILMDTDNPSAKDYYKFMIKNEMMKFYDVISKNRTTHLNHTSDIKDGDLDEQ